MVLMKRIFAEAWTGLKDQDSLGESAQGDTLMYWPQWESVQTLH